MKAAPGRDLRQAPSLDDHITVDGDPVKPCNGNFISSPLAIGRRPGELSGSAHGAHRCAGIV